MRGTNPAGDEYHNVGTWVLNRQPLDPHLLKVVSLRFTKTRDACTSAAARLGSLPKIRHSTGLPRFPFGGARRAPCSHEIGLLYRLALCGP
jgi:hypothetical protein